MYPTSYPSSHPRPRSLRPSIACAFSAFLRVLGPSAYHVLTKFIKPLQHTSATIRAPPPGLQNTPRACELQRRDPRAPALPRRRREMDKGMGCHARGEKRLPKDPRGCLLKSKAAVRSPPSQARRFAHVKACLEQRLSLLLQAPVRPLSGPCVAGGTTCCAGRDRNGPIQPRAIRL